MEQKKQKRNWFVIAGVFVGSVMALLLFARATKVLEIYRSPSATNLPAIKMGELFFATNLKQVESGKFITFRTFDSMTMQQETWIKRCVGIPGDELEMKQSVLYVNHHNFDKDYNLMNEYLLVSKAPGNYHLVQQLSQEQFQENGNDEYVLTVDNQQAASLKKELKNGDSLKPRIYGVGTYMPTFFAKEGYTTWTIDNFGPLKIPANCYFILGDNRHQSMDSRFIGFVQKDKITGVVMGK